MRRTTGPTTLGVFPNDWISLAGSPVVGRGPLGPEDRLFFQARGALFEAARSLLRTDGRSTFLMPSWACGVEIDAVAAAGARPTFYRVRRNGQMDLDDVRARLGPDVRAVMVTHYFGFPQDVRTLRTLATPRGVTIIEDCAHALFSRDRFDPIGSVGDLAVFSLRKSIAVPDGGVLRQRGPTIEPRRPSPSSATLARSLLVMLGDHLAARHPRGGALFEATVRRPARAALAGARRLSPGGQRRIRATGDLRFDPSETGLDSSWLTRYLAERVDGELVAEQRRSNYIALQERLEGHSWFVPLHPNLPEGATPLFLPIRVAERERVRAGMQARGVDTMVFGAVPHRSIDLGAFPISAVLSRQVLCLAVHQDFGRGEMARIAAVLAEVAGSLGRDRVALT